MKRIVTCSLLVIVEVWAQPLDNPFPALQRLKEEGAPVVFFRENKGQVHDQHGRPRPDILFSGETEGLVYHLRRNGLHYQLYRIHEKEPQNDYVRHLHSHGYREIERVEIYRIDISFVEAEPAQIIPEEPFPDYEHFYGEEPVLFVYRYRRVRYKNMWPGIDLIFYGGREGLEYDFELQPGADPSLIRMEVKGATVGLENGELVLSTPFGQVREGAPIAYLGMQKVPVAYLVQGRQIGFCIAETSPCTMLRIDPPVRVWGTYYGGNRSDVVWAVDVHGTQWVYIAGIAASGNNIATTGAHQSTYSGGLSVPNAFLVKFSSAGVRQWGTYYYGGGADANTWGLDCAVDPRSGSVYLVGRTAATTGIATPNAHQTAHGGGTNWTGGPAWDGFIAKFNANGVREWGTYYGGNGEDIIYGCSVGPNGELFISGYTASTNQIATAGTHKSTLPVQEQPDAFLAKFTPNGVRVWGTYYGGPSIEGHMSFPRGAMCAVDMSGNVFLVGNTLSTSGIATPGAYQGSLKHTHYTDVFVAKLNGANGTRIWGTYYAPWNNDVSESPEDCSVDPAGNVYVSLTGNGGGLVSFSSSGAYRWAVTLTGGETWGHACYADRGGNVYFGGCTYLDGLGTPGAHQPNRWGSRDAFLLKYNCNGQKIWGTYYGGGGGQYLECIHSCVSDNNGYVYGAGGTRSTDAGAISTPGAHQVNHAGGTEDGFLVRFQDPDAGCPPLAYVETKAVSNSLLDQEDDWSVFPTFTDGTINIRSTRDVVLEIWDAGGRCLGHFPVREGEERKEILPFPAGVYFIREQNSIRTIRVIIQK